MALVVPVLALVLLLLGGLGIDASRQLNARGRAMAYAEEAARAGASAVELGNSRLVVDETGARARVDDYCDRVRGTDGSVEFCGTTDLPSVSDGLDDVRAVEVQVRLAIPATLLGLVGVRELRASGTARARGYEGVRPDDVGSYPEPIASPRAADGGSEPAAPVRAPEAPGCPTSEGCDGAGSGDDLGGEPGGSVSGHNPGDAAGNDSSSTPGGHGGKLGQPGDGTGG